MRSRADEEPNGKQSGNAAVIDVAETRWHERPLLSMQLASELSSISVASLYRFADEKRLKLISLAGRTLVVTASFIELINGAEPWSPSDRGKEARAKRRVQR